MLNIENLHVSYGEVPVLTGLSLTINQGDIVALLGSNGVGKTTLNHTLSGLLKPKSGKITFDNDDITGLNPPDIVQKGLIHVPEGRKIFPNLTIEDNLLLGAIKRGKKSTVSEIYALFPRLDERKRQLAGTLSGGEQQMLAIGRALMGDPKILILDEPSLGLSPKLVEEMFILIKQLKNDGLTIFLVEQNVNQTLAIADYAFVLSHGSISLEGKATDLKENADLKKTYLGL